MAKIKTVIVALKLIYLLEMFVGRFFWSSIKNFPCFSWNSVEGICLKSPNSICPKNSTDLSYNCPIDPPKDFMYTDEFGRHYVLPLLAAAYADVIDEVWEINSCTITWVHYLWIATPCYAVLHRLAASCQFYPFHFTRHHAYPRHSA